MLRYLRCRDHSLSQMATKHFVLNLYTPVKGNLTAKPCTNFKHHKLPLPNVSKLTLASLASRLKCPLICTNSTETRKRHIFYSCHSHYTTGCWHTAQKPWYFNNIFTDLKMLLLRGILLSFHLILTLAHAQGCREDSGFREWGVGGGAQFHKI